MLLFNDCFTAPIVLKSDDSAIILAARDLQRDLRYLSDRKDGFDIVRSSSVSAVTVSIDGIGEESYRIDVTDDSVNIVGGDALGAVFGIYAFSKEVLGFSPMYRLTDVLPKKQRELIASERTITSPERRVKFRGWFLNDEDLLTDFKEGGGKRNIDYPFYQNVMHPDVLDMILECALRLENNLIIPSSFVDITNPDEEKLVETVCRRGLYVSQHHVEPMGVSYFGADNYIKEHGAVGETVSFIQNRTRMVEIWEYYAKKWAKYGDRVVWQLGLRGKADQAVWKSDPSVPANAKTRGDTISDAIATEHEIVCKALGTDSFYSTVTLWMEGAELYGKGYLKVPKDSIVIFSDIGFNQMFGEDFYTVPRSPDQKYGIYYHVGFWGEGPHLCEGTQPDKIEFCYKEASKQNSLYYSILNVSNVRPLHLGAELVSHALENPESFDGYAALRKILTPIFGEKTPEAMDIYEEYFRAFADLGSKHCMERCNKAGFYYKKYENITFQEVCANDGAIHEFGKTAFDVNKNCWIDQAHAARLIGEAGERFCALIKKMEKFEARLSGDALEYFRKFTKFGAIYMTELSTWAVAKYEMQFATGKEKRLLADRAIASLERILEERKILEVGKWEGWHRGEFKIGIKKFIKTINDMMAEEKGI